MPGYGWRRRHGRGRGRPMKPRMIGDLPEVSRFIAMSSEGNPILVKQPVFMTPDELEVLRLVDYEGLLQEEAAQRMNVSRGTVWRCLDSARRKVAMMLVEGRELSITSTESSSLHSTSGQLQDGEDAPGQRQETQT